MGAKTLNIKSIGLFVFGIIIVAIFVYSVLNYSNQFEEVNETTAKYFTATIIEPKSKENFSPLEEQPLKIIQPIEPVDFNIPPALPLIDKEFEQSLEIPKYDVFEMAKQIHDLINEERQNEELSVLEWSSGFAEVALAHSRDMAENDYFSHTDLNGNNVDDRYRLAKRGCRIEERDYYYAGGENIALLHIGKFFDEGDNIIVYYSQEDIVNDVVKGWMASEGHKENILMPLWRQEGIGITIDDFGKIYITENFC